MIRQLLDVLEAPAATALRRMLVLLVLGAVLQGIAFALLVPVLRALLGPEPDEAWPWLGVLAGVFVAYAGCHWRSQMSGYDVGTGLARSLHRALGDHVARLPLGWFSPERTGRLAQLASTSVTDVMGAPAHLLRPIVHAVVTPAVVVAVMAVLEWRLALAALLAVPFGVWTFRLTSRLVGDADHAIDASGAEAGGRLVEFAQNQPVLRAFRRTSEGHHLLDDTLVAQRDATRTLLKHVVPGFVGFVVVVQAGFTVVLVAGTAMALGGTVGAPELIALLVLSVRFVEPVIAAADLGGAVAVARNALARIDEVLRTQTLPEPVTGTAVVPDQRQSGSHDAEGVSIELDQVFFGYNPDRPVLHGVSFTIPAHTMTAVVGPSGSGKTTITHLIARFADVDDGCVRVGGTDVRDRTTHDLMAQLSLVFQDVYLFDASIADNILLARPDATQEDLERVAQQARVDEIVQRLPQGWDTRVGEGGTSLSGGERQRVSVARALLKNAPVVLLDEATSALDPENDAALQQALAALVVDRTILVIAHRLQTVVAADQIVVLQEGRVVQTGRHEDLLARGGRYADFWAERTRAQGWRLTAGARA